MKILYLFFSHPNPSLSIKKFIAFLKFDIILLVFKEQQKNSHFIKFSLLRNKKRKKKQKIYRYLRYLRP